MAVLCDLPAEILEKIFLHLDGASLARASRVCKHWRDLSDHLQLSEQHWKTCCQNEIDRDVLQELVGNQPLVQELSKTICWHNVYRRWYCLRTVRWELTSWKATYPIVSWAPVTCIALTGSCIVSGHRDGSVHLWEGFSGEHLVKLGQHHRIVQHLVLFSCKKPGSTRHLGHQLNHLFLASGSKDSTIHIFSLTRRSIDEPMPPPICLRYHSNSIESLKVFGSKLLASCADNTISLWDLTADDQNSPTPQVMDEEHFQGPPGFAGWVGYWDDTLLCLGHDGMIWTIYDNSRGDPDIPVSWCGMPIQVTGTDLQEDHFPIVTVLKCFMFRDNLMVLLTVEQYLCISTDGVSFHCQPTLAALQSCILTVALIANIFVIGTERGAVFIYRFETREDLAHLDLTKPTWKKRVTEGGSVISIDFCDHESGPILLCASSNSMHMMQWHPNSCSATSDCMTVLN